jgi:DNA-binding MarR family transcriptional regulator
MVSRDPDITRLLDRLERAHLVKRSRDAGDRRVVRARITAAGMELLGRLDRPVAELNLRLLGAMGEERLRTLLELLEQARGAGA